jgi:hypothetical protein
MNADGAGGAGGAMQFDKVELAAPVEARSCQICRRPIALEYFQIGQAIICGLCATAIPSSPLGRGRFLHALVYGLGAAALGAIGWYAIVTRIDNTWGFLAIGLGLLVGVAVKKGAQGLGGVRYQLLAMALTYASIGGAYVGMGRSFWAPLQGGMRHIMMLVIVGIGLYEAGKINRPIALSGPFRLGQAAHLP